MNGIVDSEGRALVTLHVRGAEGETAQPLNAWVDTAFTGELVLPMRDIKRLKLGEPMPIRAILADGKTIVLDAYVCFIDWFDGERAVEVIANEGRFPLLGIGLLGSRRLTIDYRAREMSLE